MTEPSQGEEQNPAPSCTALYDKNDPVQQEITRVLNSFTYDIMGIIQLGSDGIMRSLTGDRRILSAAPFNVEMIAAYNNRFPEELRGKVAAHFAGVDGSKVPEEKWFKPDDGILPAPLSQERIDEFKNESEERKELTRSRMRRDEKMTDAMGVLND